MVILPSLELQCRQVVNILLTVRSRDCGEMNSVTEGALRKLEISALNMLYSMLISIFFSTKMFQSVQSPGFTCLKPLSKQEFDKFTMPLCSQ